jgi:Flp pilus assembly secretin CpaC
MQFSLLPRRRSLFLTALASLAMTAAAAAAPMTDPIDVTIDFAKVLRIGEKADTVIVGNPGIADASIDDEKTLVLTGKTAGTTNLIVLDVDGNEIVNTVLRVSSDVRQLTTIFYGVSRQTFSCAPTCEQVISVGDNPEKFDNAKTQIETRRQFSTAQ